MDPDAGLELLCRNVVDVLSREELKVRLGACAREKRPLRVKAGFDPTAPDIHLGHTVLLRKLREFQDLGHKVVLIIGDYTAMIGDPTGRTQARPALGPQEVERNAATYRDQAFRILDPDPSKIEVVRNSEWFERQSFREFLEKIATRYTVARLLERDDFAKRMAQEQPISVRELLYPLLQGYDSVEVRADVELGGTDQKFNLIVGRNLQRSFGQEPQVVMTLPLLVGLDGAQKMSKSYGNHIGVAESPKDMFGKAMSIPDELMASYYDLLTPVPGKDVARQLESGALHPRDAKVRLASLIVAAYHGEDEARSQAAEFDRVFRDREAPRQMPEVRLTPGPVWVVDLLKKAGMASTGSDARRLIEQGAVTLDGEKITDPKAHLEPATGSVLRAGRTKFAKLVVH